MLVLAALLVLAAGIAWRLLMHRKEPFGIVNANPAALCRQKKGIWANAGNRFKCMSYTEYWTMFCKGKNMRLHPSGKYCF